MVHFNPMLDLAVIGAMMFAASLIAAIAVVCGGRSRRLKTLMALIAVLAVLMGVAIVSQRSQALPPLRLDDPRLLKPPYFYP